MKRGYTLVEVVMAIFISAIVVTAVFSVVLSSRSGTRAGARKQKAYMVINGVLNDLKNYVTADPNPCTSQNPDCMTGPVNPFNSAGCDNNTWGLIDDYCGGNCRGNDNLLNVSTLDTCRSVIAGDP
ncbi:MAG: type II secretion system protein, partial [Elusimicrobia bacterium]|nr:type II secretion system protein [Elusimicrobiota bacterium]